MPKAISNDNFLAPQPAKSRKNDASRRSDPDAAAQRRQASGGADTAELDRAQLRLAQEADARRGATVTSLDQARAIAQSVSAQISANPQAALKAHATIDPNLFTAASARPSA